MKPAIMQYLMMIVFAIAMIPATAQHSLTVASGTHLKVAGGTSLYIDGLVLKPSASYDITGANNLSRNITATPPPPGSYIQRVYQFLAGLPAFSGDLTIYYQDSELAGLAEGALNLNVHNGSAWTNYNAGTQSAVNNFVTTSGLNNILLSQATLGNSGAALPVTLSSFWGKADNCKVLLQWTTASEQNSRHFEIQYSADGLIYTSVAIVPASGNSSTEKQYSHHYNLAGSNNYFRLIMVDINGSSKLSPVINIRSNCATGNIAVFPNPAKDIIRVIGLTGKNTLQVFDAMGRQVAIKHTSNAVEQINLAALPSGSYAVQIIKGGAVIQSIKFIKQY